MSGGYFDYNQFKITEIADELDVLITNEDLLEYNDETKARFKEAVDLLRTAFIYTQRIDWLLSYDDGEETFHSRLKQELGKLV